MGVAARFLGREADDRSFCRSFLLAVAIAIRIAHGQTAADHPQLNSCTFDVDRRIRSREGDAIEVDVVLSFVLGLRPL